MKKKNEFFTVEFVDLDEGYFGDYDPDDPDDTKLIRFDVYDSDGEMLESRCTMLPVNSDEKVLCKELYKILAAFTTERSSKSPNYSILADQLSYISGNEME